jgi:hypothetical protein
MTTDRETLLRISMIERKVSDADLPTAKEMVEQLEQLEGYGGDAGA